MCKYALGAMSITGTQSNELLLRAKNCSGLVKSYMIGGPLKHALKTALLCAGGFLAETTRKFFMQFVVVHCSPSPASKLAVRHLIMFPIRRSPLQKVMNPLHGGSVLMESPDTSMNPHNIVSQPKSSR